MAQKISEYRIIRAHRIDSFEAEVQDALLEGWQPMNRHGYESTDEYNYVMEMVRLMEEDDYRDMVADVMDDIEADEDEERHMNLSPENEAMMNDIVARILRQEDTLNRMQRQQNRGMDSTRPDPIFDDQLFTDLSDE